MATDADAPLYDLNAMPWGSGISSSLTSGGHPTEEDLNAAAANVAAASANVAAANASLAAAQATLAAKIGEMESAQANFRAKGEIYAPLLFERRKAQTSYDAIRRRPSSTEADIAQARTRLNAAEAAAQAYDSTELNTAYTAALAAMSAVTSARSLDGAPDALANAQAALEYNQFRYKVLSETPASGDPYVRNHLTGADEVAQTLYSADGSIFNINSFQYQHVLFYFDDNKEELLKASPVVRVTWTEVNVFDPNVPDGSPRVEPSVSYAQRTEDCSLAAAVQLPGGGGKWIFFGTIHQINAPGSGGTSVKGVPALPEVGATVQYRGTERFRQGWSEYQTPSDQIQAKRYRTMEASGVGFEGQLALDDPPAWYHGGDWLDLDPRIVQGSYQLPGRPLVVYDSLNDAARPATALPDSLVSDSDGARLLSRTARQMTSPAGLRWELSDEETPGSIVEAVAGANAVAWPSEPTPEDPIPSPLPRLAFDGAMRFVSSDRVMDQSMRYTLFYNVNDSRNLPETTFAVGFRWELRRRNLLTGTVVIEERSTSKTFHGGELAFDRDEDWTEVTAGENESITIMPLPGSNPTPHLFSGYPSLTPARVA